MADLLERLRTATRPLHDKLDGAPISTSVMDGTLTAEDYRVLVAWQLRAHLVAEEGLAEFGWPGEYRYVARLPALLAEAGHLRLVVPEVTSLAAPGSLAEAMGRAYVLEGSSLGGNMILGHLKGNEGLKASAPFAFYDFQRREGLGQWRGFLAFVRTIDFGDAEVEVCEAAAVRVFEIFGKGA